MRPITTCMRSGFVSLPGLLAILLLAGCGSARYRADYNGFNSAYADSANHQMLLNLARLDQHDPTYFLQFGQISVSYQLSSSLNVAASDTIPQSTIHVPLVTGVGTATAGATTTPSFTFIPVTDDKVAAALLQPVPPEVLYSLFQQGWPVDQLMRLMVQRFEIHLPGQTGVSTFTNSLADGDAKSYAVFLKMCAIARQLQIDGTLKLRGEMKFVPLIKGWTSSKAPEAKDILDAHDKQLVYQQDAKGQWELGSEELVPTFVLGDGSERTFARLAQQPIYSSGESIGNMRAILANGFSVEENVETEAQSTSSHLVMRSFLNILAAAATEQNTFDAVRNWPVIVQTVPDTELQPILRLRWYGDSGPLLDPLLAIDYHGHTYEVTDPATNIITEKASWNRDVFRLLTQLAFQVSVDTSKFPLPTTLQVIQ